MNVILNVDGGLVKRNVLPLSARQVTWFIDPEALLRHLGDLKDVKVSAFCQTCYERGLPEDVAATFNAQKREWTVRCACADYPPIKDTGRRLTIRQTTDDGTVKIIPVWSVDELLQNLGWSFRCAGDCQRLGMNDGVQGENDPKGSTLHVNCGCTERIYREAGAA